MNHLLSPVGADYPHRQEVRLVGRQLEEGGGGEGAGAGRSSGSQTAVCAPTSSAETMLLRLLFTQ